MKKLQIDLASILVLALVIAGAIWTWGEYLGIGTPEAKSYWLSVVAIGALVLAIVASLDRREAADAQAKRGSASGYKEAV